MLAKVRVAEGIRVAFSTRAELLRPPEPSLQFLDPDTESSLITPRLVWKRSILQRASSTPPPGLFAALPIPFA